MGSGELGFVELHFASGRFESSQGDPCWAGKIWLARASSMVDVCRHGRQWEAKPGAASHKIG